MAADGFSAVCERVQKRVSPDPAERERVAAVVETVRERAAAVLADLPVDAEVIQVGSTARDTWLAGNRDIDVFVRFPGSLTREELESFGLEVGHHILPEGREEFAEHPYVVGEIDGFEVDLVPCYDVPDATQIESSVDRTPFHTTYLTERLDEDIAGDIRVCKQFLTAIRAYGSNLRTRGFSGYLTELLVLEHDGFRPLVEAAADWQPPVHLDPESHGDPADFDAPLVVVDPTDPDRNVAAVCAPEHVARFQHYARDLLADPREEAFERSSPLPIPADDLRDALADRGTSPIAVRFTTPDVVEDQLWPQLQKSRTGLAGALDRAGFDVLRSRALADDEEAALLFECEVASLSAIERHRGPPVHVRSHAESFYEIYATEEEVVGPFIDGEHYVVEREREFRRPSALLRSDTVFDVSLGTDVKRALADHYDVLAGPDVADLADRFGTELARYLDPSP